MTLRANDVETSLDGNTSAATTTAEKITKKLSTLAFHHRIRLTLEYHGFSKVDTIKEKATLLGLYQGLLIHLPNPPSIKTLYSWQKKDRIAGGMCKSFKNGRSESFNGFENHQHVVD